jgi:hypothetical protein
MPCDAVGKAPAQQEHAELIKHVIEREANGHSSIRSGTICMQ